MDTDKNGSGSTPASGVAGCASHPAVVRAGLTRTLDIFRRERVFREGAKNCARGGRATRSFRGFTHFVNRTDNYRWTRVKSDGADLQVRPTVVCKSYGHYG